MSRPISLWHRGAHPAAIVGSILRVHLPHVAIGELCLIQASAANAAIVGHGVVVAVEQSMASIGLLQDCAGLSVECIVVPTGRLPSIRASSALLGSVLDAQGQVVERLAPALPGAECLRTLGGQGGDYRQRLPIEAPLRTGVRAIDGLLTCGEGQRMGIFAAAGAGKSTLTEMLLENTDADVFVIALIGERGREVASMVDRLRGSARAAQTVLVQATSDAAPALRINAGLLATTIAEHFRGAGRRVLLMMDSLTRYARALRELALSAGEAPARRGYPASVFEALPRLLERVGRDVQGCITAFYTVLLEDEQDADPVGEEVKSLLDGHIYLSSRLANRGHYPALDILRSNSRLFMQLATPEQQSDAIRCRGLLGTLEDLQLMRDLGEYKPGASAHYDAAIAAEPGLTTFLRQRADEHSDFAQTLRRLHELAH